MNFANPHFAEPRWLWPAALAVLCLLALQRYAAWARRRQIAQFAAPRFAADLTPAHSPARRALKDALLVLAVAGMGLALARPQWGETVLEESQAPDEDIIFALDCSRSMLAADAAPSRLQRAKLALQNFARLRGGRIGLVAFAGQAFLQCPLTLDCDAFDDALAAVDEKIIPVGGTDIGRALNESFRAMDKTARRKIVVLITDGEDLGKGGLRTAESLAKKDLVVFAVGVGSPAGAEIRITNEQGQLDLVRDNKGEPVHSRLDETGLRAIARATHGEYYPLGRLGEGLAKVLSSLETTNGASGAASERREGTDRYHLAIAAVLALLVMESLMGTRRRPDREAATT